MGPYYNCTQNSNHLREVDERATPEYDADIPGIQMQEYEDEESFV